MSKTYKIGEGKRIYAVGDIHGYADVLARMHDVIEEDLAARPIPQAQIVYLGDYVSRGPDSKGVIDMLIERPKAVPHIDHVFLLGNHENRLVEFIRNPEGINLSFKPSHDIAACKSYGLDSLDRHENISKEVSKKISEELKSCIPENHISFMEDLKVTHIVDDYLFVHSGFRPGIALESQTLEDLIYTREPFLSYEEYHEHFVVHGHTVSRQGEVDHKHNRLNLDSGLYNGGPLSCAAIEGDDIRILQAWQKN